MSNNFKLALFLFSFVLLVFSSLLYIFSSKYNSSDFAIDDFFTAFETPHEIHRIDFRNHKIRYIQSGLKNEAAPLLLFVHGTPGTWEEFKTFLVDYDLTRMATLISMDRIGYGDTNIGKVEPNLIIQSEAIKKVIKQNPNRKTILIGNGLGAAIVAKCAIDFPEIVDQILLVAPVINFEVEPRDRGINFFDWNIIQWLIPDYYKVAHMEKKNQQVSLMAISSDWKKLDIPVIHFQGLLDEEDSSKKQITFSQKHIDPDCLSLIISKDANHLAVKNKAGTLKKIILNLL